VSDESREAPGVGGRRLLNATAVMASGTMVSRILGFGRAVLLAFVLGNSTRQVEMFGLATLIPNTLYMLFAGGALNTVLVPQIVRAIRNDSDGGQRYVNRIITAFLAALAVIPIREPTERRHVAPAIETD
jgi:putative peptidoglycan lipid II flippase